MCRFIHRENYGLNNYKKIYKVYKNYPAYRNKPQKSLHPRNLKVI